MTVFEWLVSIGAWLATYVGPWLLPLIPVLGFLWGLHIWRYGGSVVRLQLQLGTLDALGALMTAPSRKWRHGPAPESVLDRKIDPTHADVAVVTARNHGRTPATITGVGLRFTKAGGHAVSFTSALLEPGERAERVRIEAHDARTFVFPITAMAEAAKELEQKHPKKGNPRELQARAQGITGTGRKRRSSRWSAWRINMQSVHLGGVTPTIEAQLFSRHVGDGMSAQDLAGEISMIMVLVRDGKDLAEITRQLSPTDGSNIGQTYRRSLLIAEALGLYQRLDPDSVPKTGGAGGDDRIKET